MIAPRLPLHLALLASLFLFGCAQQPLSPVDNFERYRQALSKVEDWRLQGKMNLRVPGESETVRVNWSNSSEGYSIRLSGSLGLGATWIHGDEYGVRMERGGQEPIVAASPEDLVYTQLGRDLPLSDLHYWVRGLPAPYPRPTSRRFAAEGMLTHLSQAGWEIDYSNFQAVGPWNLPGKIVAQRDDLRLTMLISNWTLDVTP